MLVQAESVASVHGDLSVRRAQEERVPILDHDGIADAADVGRMRPVEEPSLAIVIVGPPGSPGWR